MLDHKFQDDEICAILLKQRSAALRVCANPDRVAGLLAKRIALANRRRGAIPLSLREISEFAHTDYRSIARAFHTRCHSVRAPKRRRCRKFASRLHFVKTLDELCDSPKALTAILYDHAFDQELFAFLDQSHGAPGLFVEEQFDFPNRNAVFRDGVVKSWHLPFGTCVVSKRDNKRKPNRLLEEQRNLSLILERLRASTEAHIAFGHSTKETYLTISRPICVLHDPATAYCYAISLRKPGETLEEVLIDSRIPHELRQQHLKNYRLCLDLLFDNGIVWRDMSPRNVLVEQGDCVLYHLMDFEKVEIWDGSLSLQSRIDACRSQFCVEEFGVIVLQEELLDTFSGLFFPDQWDLQSSAPLPFPPRAEAAAVLAGRGIGRVSIGQFNRLDQQIGQVRYPRNDPRTCNLIRPGLLGFRVEHYLSLSENIDASDYDRKTTEVLLAANDLNRLIETVHYLSTYVDDLEVAIVVAEFDAILQYGHSRFIQYPNREAQRLCAAIDLLYTFARDQNRFASVLNGRISPDA